MVSHRLRTKLSSVGGIVQLSVFASQMRCQLDLSVGMLSIDTPIHCVKWL